jgi:hypothetical protein
MVLVFQVLFLAQPSGPWRYRGYNTPLIADDAEALSAATFHAAVVSCAVATDC